MLISLAASAVAFVLLWKLVNELRGEATAGRTVLYLAVFPTTLFLFAVYSESLYLHALGGGVPARRRAGAGAAPGVATGLAALTRVSGVMLLPALAVLAWRATNRRSAFARLAVSLPIMALWPLYLGLAHGRPFVFLSAQRAGWDRRLSAAGPLGGAWDALVEGWRGVRQLVAGSGHDYFPSPDHGAMYGAGLNLEQLAYAVLLVALGIYAWKALGAAYGIFVLGSLALPFSDPLPGTPLLSMPRFALGRVSRLRGARPARRAAAREHGARDDVRGAARDQPRPLGALDLGGLSAGAGSDEDRERVALASKTRFGDVAEVLAVRLERKRPVAADGRASRGRARCSTRGIVREPAAEAA